MTRLYRYFTELSAQSYFAALSGYVVFLAVGQFLAIGASLGRVRLSQPLALGILMVALAAAVAYWRLVRDRERASESAEEPGVLWHPVMVATLFAALTGGLLWVCAYWQPDLTWDGNIYHIPMMHFWAQKGYVHWIEQTSVARPWMNGYPKGVELAAFVLVQALGNSHFVTSGNLLFLPLGVLGIAYLARSLGAPGQTALFAGLAYLLVPVNLNQAVTTYVDSGYAAAVIAMFAAACYASRAFLDQGRLPWGVVPILGGAMGLSAAAKSPGSLAVLVVFGSLGGLILLAPWFRRGREQRSNRPQALALLGLTLVFAGLTGGYWYLRNYVYTGSPLYPVGLTLAGHVIFPGATVDFLNVNANYLPPTVRSWPDPAIVAYTWCQGLKWPGKKMEYDSATGGLGYFWILVCVPSVCFLLISYFRQRPRPVAWTALLALLPAAALIFLATPLHWWTRYVLWLYAFGLPAAAVVLGRAGKRRNLPPLAKLWLVGGLCLMMVESAWGLVWVARQCYPGDLHANPKSILASANWRWPSHYLFPALRETEFDRLLSDDRAIAVGHLESGRGMLLGELSLPLGQRRIVGLDSAATQLSSTEEEIGYVVWDETMPVPPLLDRVAERRGHVDGFWLLRMRTQPARQTGPSGRASPWGR